MLKFMKEVDVLSRKNNKKISELDRVQKSRITESDFETAGLKCDELLEYFNKHGKLPISS